MPKPINEYFFHDQLSPQAMDHLWEHGWRHFGSYFYRYSVLNESQQHVMPLRLRLSDFRLSQSQKRVLKKNRDLHVKFLPAFVNAEVHNLFNAHKQRFSSNVPENIYVFVSQQPALQPCECLSLCLYRELKLIAISYLDLGKTACSSVFQCFDPSESRRSLGIFMILQSIAYAQSHDKIYYYPGYAYHEASHYDYKKAFSGLTYFDWQGNWLALEAKHNLALTVPQSAE